MLTVFYSLLSYIFLNLSLFKLSEKGVGLLIFKRTHPRRATPGISKNIFPLGYLKSPGAGDFGNVLVSTSEAIVTTPPRLMISKIHFTRAIDP